MSLVDTIKQKGKRLLDGSGVGRRLNRNSGLGQDFQKIGDRNKRR